MNATTSHTETRTVDALNSLLRGELSAVETYDQAIEKFEGEAIAVKLRLIRDEHSEAVQTLRDRVARSGDMPSESAGVWGAFANAVTAAAKVIGPETVIGALRSGEEHGIERYEEALEKTDVADDIKMIIRTDLLPSCRDHVLQLHGLADSVKK